jgi:hypothetical protein
MRLASLLIPSDNRAMMSLSLANNKLEAKGAKHIADAIKVK